MINANHTPAINQSFKSVNWIYTMLSVDAINQNMVHAILNPEKGT